MDNPILRQFNAYEIIMFLHEMHQRGYEKLRLLSGMSPNGCAWRWFIYPKVLMKTDNRFEYHGDFVPFDCPFGSTGDGDAQSKSNHTIDEAIQCNEGYFNLARGRDEEYVLWFSTIVEQSKHGNYPIAFADCYLAKRWTFTGNPIEIPFPPRFILTASTALPTLPMSSSSALRPFCLINHLPPSLTKFLLTKALSPTTTPFAKSSAKPSVRKKA